LTVEVTDPVDPLLLFTCEVREEDFPALKQQQQLVVEYGQFPAMLNHLLSQVGEGTRQCRLSRTTGVLELIETSEFKVFIHLSLTLKEANDTQAKHHLAARLTTERLAKERSLAEARELREALEASRTAEEVSKERLARVAEDNARRDATHAAALAETKARASEEREALAARHEAVLARERDEASARIRELEARAAESSARVSTLTAEKRGAESEVASLAARLEAALADAREARAETAEVRAENLRLGSEKFELSRAAQTAAVHTAGLEQLAKDKAELVASLQAMLAGAEAQRRTLEESLALQTANASRLEGKVRALTAEIHKGNEVILSVRKEHADVVRKCQALIK
jgi:hypothetical protein